MKNETWKMFDTLEPIMVTVGDIRNVQTGVGFTNRLIDFAKNLFDVYKNDATGMDNIVYNTKSVRNVKEHARGEIDFALLRYVPQLIKHGIYLETQPRTEKLDSHVFVAKIKVDHKEMAAGFIVREDINGKRYYEHTSIEKMALDRLNDQAPQKSSALGISAENPTSATRAIGYESLIKIMKKHLAVQK